jgi:hypothetical protein
MIVDDKYSFVIENKVILLSIAVFTIHNIYLNDNILFVIHDKLQRFSLVSVGMLVSWYVLNVCPQMRNISG